MSNFKKETRDRLPEQAKEYLQRLSDSLINIYEQKSKEIDGVNEQGAIDFKFLILDQYYASKDKATQIKFYQLINKFLKNESKDIGLKIYKLLYNKINVHQYNRKLRKKLLTIVFAKHSIIDYYIGMYLYQPYAYLENHFYKLKRNFLIYLLLITLQVRHIFAI